MPNALCAIHVALTAVMCWLAAILVLPGDTFGTGKGWIGFAAIAGENTWSMMFWLAGLAGMAGIGTHRPAIRLGSVLLLALSHACVAGLMLWSSPAGSGSGTYGILAGLGYYLAWRHIREGI